MQVKRFVTEYANHKIDKIWKSETMQDGEKAEQIRKIDRYVAALKNGLITIDECMGKLAEI